MNQNFDIVIPVGPNEITYIHKMIEYTKKNIINYRNIYLVTPNINLTIIDCITIDEKIYPFNFNTLKTYLGNTERNGWYLQQLIKLYSGLVIPNILNNYLVIDADTIFLKPTIFFYDKIPLYNIGTEYHIPYFEHMSRLHPTLIKQINYSGICHHMIFQTHIIKELFTMIENYHHIEPYKAILKCIDKNHISGSGMSEYEIYFNYLLIYHKKKINIRNLKWANMSSIDNTLDFDYISCHWYMR